MEYKYITITPSEGTTSLEKAMLISKELYYLSRPKTLRQEDDVSNYLFAWIKGNNTDLHALEFDENYIINIHDDNDILDLIKYTDSATEQEITTLSDYIKQSNSIIFKDIIPGTTTVLTKQDLIDNGFIIEEEII